MPDAGLLQSTPRPVRFMNGSITSSGNPYGYVGNATAVTTPISSQWPAVVSLPFDRSSSRPATAGAPGCGGHPSSGSTLPSPSASRLGRSRPPTARATFPSVSEPSSPHSAASGNSPAPTASSTITQARGMPVVYARHGNRSRTDRAGALRRRRSSRSPRRSPTPSSGSRRPSRRRAPPRSPRAPPASSPMLGRRLLARVATRATSASASGV